MNRIRPRALVVGVLAALGVILSIAVVSADEAPDDIVLTLEEGTNQFDYRGVTQRVEVGKAECKITSDSRSGDTVDPPGGSLIEMTATTYDNAGHPKPDAPIGLVEDGLGVNLKGNGNGQECGRIDHIGGFDDDGQLKSERLWFSLGKAVDDKLLESIDFDFEAKYDPTVRFRFFRNGILVDEHSYVIGGDASDSGPDSKYLDKHYVTDVKPENEQLFDSIEISMESGGASVEGGATWEFKGDGEADAHRTVFHLVDAVATATIADTTTGVTDGIVAAGAPFTWTWTVTNTGNLRFADLAVSVAVGETTAPASCEDMALDPGDTTTCTLEADAPPDDFHVVADLSATSESETPVSATVTTSYFGSDPDVSIVVDLEDDTVLPDAMVMWEIRVMNIGNVLLRNVEVGLADDGEVLCSDLGNLEPGGLVLCEYDHDPEFGYHETAFSVTADAPLGVVVDETSETYSYVGTLSCDEPLEQGLPGLDDTPRVAFAAGPNTKDEECEVPINLLSEVNMETGVQTVTVAPPDGYTWDNVSGIVTIEWDGETVSTAPIARTVLGTDPLSDPVIRWCNDIVGIALAFDGSADPWYYELSPSDGMYPAAVIYDDPSDPEETCLVLQSTTTVNDGGVIKTQTTEVFYIYNDPIFSR